MRYIKLIISVIAFSLVIWACEKEGDLLVVSGFGASELSTDNTDIILSQENTDVAVLSLSWTESTLSLSDETKGVPASIPTVVIEVSASSEFDPVLVINPTSKPYVFTGAMLNTLAKNLFLDAGESSPVYFRVRSALGRNTDPAYSETLTINVTPFEIDMSRGFILNTSREETGYYLYSPDSDGEYSGFMNATGWYNWYFSEGDETIWGNLAEGGEFVLTSNEDTQWNLWFPGLGGCYFATLSTNDEEWTATYIPELNASGDVEGILTFVRPEVYWLLSFTTTSDNARFTVSGDVSTYNVSTSTDNDAAIAGSIAFLPQNGSALSFSFTDAATEFVVPVAGEYTLKIFLDDLTNLHYSIEEGSVVIEDPISEYLYLPGIDDGISGSWTFDTYIRLISDMDSTFAGVVNVNSLWGYNMSLEEGEWDDVYKYGGAEGVIEFRGNDNIPAPVPGLYLIEADLKNLTYSHTEINSVSYAGLNDNWTMVAMDETEVPGVYTSNVTITAVSEWGGKIYLNDNWDLAFGGEDGLLLFGGDGFTDDAEIGEGDYDLIADLGNASYVFLGDEVYITGLNDVWDFSTVVLTKISTGVYTGTATIDAPSPWGIAIHIDQSWNRYFGGSFDSLSYLGENITDDQSLAAGTYNVTVDFINNTCTFVIAD